MEQVEVFQVLGIAATRDELIIKNAYREKLSVTNPEDNPEGFKRLRAAYDEACRLARLPKGAENEEEERDITPSGLWLERIAAIYEDITTRCDEEQWRIALSDEVFVSLEEEENCRWKLLRFLMEHYHMPTGVWKLLDEKLEIVGDKEHLRESFPAEFISFIANKCEQGESIHFEQFQGENTASYDLFLHYYEQCNMALAKNELEQAAIYIENADELQISHPVLEISRAQLREKQSNAKEAIVLLKTLKENFSGDIIVTYNLAEMLWRNGKREEAAKYYEEILQKDVSHYMSNVRLSEWYYEQKRYQDAKKVAEKVLSFGGDDYFREILKKINYELELELEQKYRADGDDYATGLELGWCYLQDGQCAKGIRLVRSLADKVPEKRGAEYWGLLTKLYFEMAEYESALAMTGAWERALDEKVANPESEEEKEKDLDRLKQMHIIRMNCFQARADMKGTYSFESRKRYYHKALEEVGKLENGTSEDIKLLMAKASIYMDMEEYTKCIDTTQQLILDYQIYAAYAIQTECYRRQWNAQGVIQAARQCIAYFPEYTRAYEHIAKVYLDLHKKEELLQILAEAEGRGVKSVMLDAYRYQAEHDVPSAETIHDKLVEFRSKYFSKVDEGQISYYLKGLPIITEYLYCYPCDYTLLERALFHRSAKHYKEAIADFEKVFEECPNQPYALIGLSFTYKYMGDYENALVYMKRAIRYRDKDISNYILINLAEIYTLLGDHVAARKVYEELLLMEESAAKDKECAKKYALCLVNCGEAEKAIEVLADAYEKVPLEFFNRAIHIYQLVGEKDKAQELLREWGRKLLSCPNFMDYYSRAAWQELIYGKSKSAVGVLNSCLAMQKGEDARDTLVQMTFAAIVSHKDRAGRKAAAKLRKYFEQDAKENKYYYFHQEKEGLFVNLLANYYEMTDEQWEQMLCAEGDCSTCYSCKWGSCRKLEVCRVLMMLRKGQTQEAMERIERNLSGQPYDEYMIALRHMSEQKRMRK